MINSKELVSIADLAQKKKEIQKTTFPIHAFPPEVSRIIMNLNECLNFPVDYSACSMLASISIAVGNSVQVEVKRGWTETAIMYLALVGRAGVNKSHPLSFALKPIIDQDKRAYLKYKQQIKEYKSQFQKADKEISEKPNCNKTIVSDITVEAVAKTHELNQRGLIVNIDELLAWIKGFNRYNNGSSDQEFWLSNWSGKPIIVDRKTSESIRIERSFISVCGTIQTSILDQMAKNNRSDNGFIDRVLFTMPGGLKKEVWSKKELPKGHEKRWSSIIDKLLSIDLDIDLEQGICPKTVFFDKRAKEKLDEWQEHNSNMCNNAGDEKLSGIYSKFEVHCVRMCLIIHMLKYSISSNNQIGYIEESSVKSAIEIIEYFRSMSEKVFDIIHFSNPLDLLSEAKRKLYLSLPNKFRTYEIINEGEKLDIKKKTAERFLQDKQLFKRIGHGNYQKLI